MLVPVSVSRSGLILKIKGSKSLVSTTFIATFSNGTQKFLNRKEWEPTALLKAGEQAESKPVEVMMSRDSCPLYFRDWANVPTLASWDLHYPSTPIVPQEIAELTNNPLYFDRENCTAKIK